MECLRGDIIIDLCQEFQEYKIPALAQKQRNFVFHSSFGPSSSAEVEYTARSLTKLPLPRLEG